MPVGSRSSVCRSKSRQQLAPDRLAGTALEQHVVGQDHGRTAVDVQDRHDVLDEVELLVARGDDEVLPLDLAGPRATSRPSAPTIVSDDLRPNGGLDSTTEHRAPGSAIRASLTSMSDSPSGVPMPCSSRFIAASRAVPSTSSYPVDEAVAQVVALGRGQVSARAGRVLVRDEQEAAGAAGRVDDRVVGVGLRCTSTIAWISARGVKYCPAPDLMSSAPLASSSS